VSLNIPWMPTADPLDGKQRLVHWTSTTLYWSEIAGPPQRHEYLPEDCQSIMPKRETFCNPFEIKRNFYMQLIVIKP
jgi:hypothetical protein